MSLQTALSAEFKSIPSDLQASTQAFFVHLDKEIAKAGINLAVSEVLGASFPRVACCSQFVRENCLRHPLMLQELINSGDLLSADRRECYFQSLNLADEANDAAVMKKLRLFRRREMLRIAWRDLAGWADLDETLQDLSALAEVCIQSALNYLYQQACERRGTPVLQNGAPFNLVVLGMGKLGGRELNFSSDIDLIFAYQEEGTLKDRKETSYGEFFTRICRTLCKFLDEITADGFVYRTDVRLRPFGDSGPLIMTFDGMEHYYMTQAREWERYAMIKARQVAGDFTSGKQLAAMIRPFVYRRYLDYGAFEELRSLKFQISQELRRKDRLDNIKLGPGGIREIEFIGQAFQLIRGGHEPELQQREIQKILPALKKLGLMTQDDAEKLTDAYRFLRRVENHIQAYQDKQAHDLPKSPLVQQRLAFSVGFSDWADFKAALDKVRATVHGLFGQVFSVSEQDKVLRHSDVIWAGESDRESCLEMLAEYGYRQCDEVLRALQYFKSSHALKRLTSKGASVVDRLLPQLIETVRSVENQDETLIRILKLFEEVAGRNVYFSLLAENPDALSQLVQLSSASQWICEYMAQYPVLFDELLDARTLYEPLQKEALREQLAYELSKVNLEDDEQLMFMLRQFKHQNVLRVAAADIMNMIPLMVVSDYLTYIAEVILEQVVERAWHIMTTKHGFPSDTDTTKKNFAVLGMGKLGGIELGYGSDLDLIFLYHCKNGLAMTTGGARPLSSAQLYLRLGQKIRHILDTKLLSGVLYEVDLRLRPSGNSGLLVTQLDSYEQYLLNDAWTWEHQALVRGRIICGDEHIKTRFEKIRRHILTIPRNFLSLKQEVREMREKMRDQLSPKNREIFHLKHSEGGIADIEFIVQFYILAHASENKALVTYTDNVRLLESLARFGFLSQSSADFLTKAYCAYRDYGHQQILQGRRAEAEIDRFVDMRKRIAELWQELME